MTEEGFAIANRVATLGRAHASAGVDAEEISPTVVASLVEEER